MKNKAPLVSTIYCIVLTVISACILIFSGCNNSCDKEANQYINNNFSGSIASNVLEQPYNEKFSEQHWELDVDVISEKLIANAKYYNEHIIFGPSGGPSDVNPVCLVIADITQDGCPEIFIGPGDMAGNVRFTAYTNDLRVLPIGEGFDDIPDHFAFYCNVFEDDFLFGRTFINTDTNMPYFIARGWNGRKGASSESYYFTWFWIQNGEWRNTFYRWGLKDIDEKDLSNHTQPLVFSQQVIFTNSEPMDYKAVPVKVKACIEEYTQAMYAGETKNNSED